MAPVSYEEAEGIPGFTEFCEARPTTAKNLRTRDRHKIPWEIIGQLLIVVWRDGIEEQRDRIALQEREKAQIAALRKVMRALDLARDSLKDPD
ncbi:MAG TPA: hypothetical protein VKA83_09290 [Methylomirabilota bacterium]|nr:hypothetical protein [Methylomirabilota bacterium]